MQKRIGIVLALIVSLAFLLCGCNATNSTPEVPSRYFKESGLSKEQVVQSFLDTPLAHRGLYNNKKGIPENSIAAFEAAAENGYPIELDVQLTSDGQLAIMHDTTMERTTGKDWKIFDHTLNEICNVKLLHSDENVPSFKEVLECVDGRVPIMVEIKVVNDTDEKRQLIIEALEKDLSLYNGSFAVQSFDFDVAEKFLKLHGEEVPVCYVCSEEKMPEDIPGIKDFDFVGISLNRLNPDVAVAYHEAGLKILTWTAKDSATQEEAYKLGADSVVFEGYLPNTL